MTRPAPPRDGKATPSVFSGRIGRLSDVDVSPELREHPRIGEYLRYAKPMRFPKTFTEWLAQQAQIEAGRSLLGVNLQRMMDEDKFCQVPSKVRVLK